MPWRPVEAGKKTCAKKILVVDDDEGIRDTMIDVLHELGYDVDQASSGYEAVIMEKKKQYDTILMDIRMPGMSGFTACKKMKEGSKLANIVFVSAYADSTTEAEIARDGYTFLRKPVEFDVLKSIIDGTIRS